MYEDLIWFKITINIVNFYSVIFLGPNFADTPNIYTTCEATR